MAPVGPSDPVGDMRFILNVLAACNDSRVNAKVVAKAESMNHSTTVYPKLHRILTAHGFKYENGKVTQVGPVTADAGKPATGVAKKKVPAGAVKKSSKPSAKKRKTEEVEDDSEDDGDNGNAGDASE